MKKSIEIALHVIGSINQNIEILTTETPEQFKAKLEIGEYITTIGSSKKVLELPTMKIVGLVIEQEAGDDITIDIDDLDF